MHMSLELFNIEIQNPNYSAFCQRSEGRLGMNAVSTPLETLAPYTEKEYEYSRNMWELKN